MTYEAALLTYWRWAQQQEKYQKARVFEPPQPMRKYSREENGAWLLANPFGLLVEVSSDGEVTQRING